MSFSDEENKMIEDEENKAEEEIKAKFKSFFSEEELKASEDEYKELATGKRTPPVTETENGKASVRTGEKSKQRIYGAGYSMNGHKIMTDSDNVYDPLKNDKKSSVYTLPSGVHIFSQEAIPKASNELTRSGKINNTRKVKSRVRKLEKAGEAGRRESQKRQDVSVFSKEARTETEPLAYYYNAEKKADNVVASGKVNPNTAKISRETIERLLNEAKDNEDVSLNEDEIKMLAAGRQARQKVSGAGKDRKTSSGAKAKRAQTKRSSSQRARQPQLKSVDNSKRKLRQRARAYQRGKKAGPGRIVARLIVLAVFIAICIAGYFTAKAIFDDSPMDPNDMTKIVFTVDDKTTDSSVAEFLVKNNMVESELIYKIRAKIFDADYVNGSYELSPSFSTERIINTLSGFDYSSGG